MAKDTEDIKYKEFKILIEDEDSLRIYRPNGISHQDKIPMDSLRKETIRIFSKWLADDRIKERKELTVLGSHLYNGLFSSDISKQFKTEYDNIQKEPATILRLILEFEQGAKELAEMPWEYIYCPDEPHERGFFLATRSKLILARHVPLNVDLPNPVSRPLRILMIVSKPEKDSDGTEMGPVNAEPVIKTIEDLKDRRKDDIKTDTLFQPMKRALTEKIKDFKPHVLHFMGHGKYKNGAGYLALVSDEDTKKARWISDQDLADCFVDYQPHLIFLHACEGAHTDSYAAFRGVALQLAYQKVPAVVAMQYEVTNKMANTFANKFYESLGKGNPIDAAVQEGRMELGMYLEEQNFSSRAFGSPVVYLQTAQGIIIAQSKQAPTPPHAEQTIRCPYTYSPRQCKGWVPVPLPKEFNNCPTCGGELMECPNGHVMGKEQGRCSCGYKIESRPKSASMEEVPQVVGGMKTPEGITGFDERRRG